MWASFYRWKRAFHLLGADGSVELRRGLQQFCVAGRMCSIPSLCYAKSLQSCLTLCDPIDGSPPGSPIPGIVQARTLEWVAISFFNAWKWKVKGKSLSHVWLLATPWTAAYQAPPSMGFSRQEYWSGVPFPSPIPSLLLPNYWGARYCASQHLCGFTLHVLSAI